MRNHTMPFNASDTTCISEDGVRCACLGRSEYWEPICKRFIEAEGIYAGPFRLEEEPTNVYLRCQQCLDAEQK